MVFKQVHRTYMLFLQVNLIAEGRLDYGTHRVYPSDFTALAANVKYREIHVTCILPASTKGFNGRAGLSCILCIDGFMESFYLFSYCILTVTQIQKEVFKNAFFFFFFLLPRLLQIVFQVPSFINGSFFFLFLFALHNSQAVYFFINQTSMMLY